MKKMVSRTLSVHKEHELLMKLEAAGLDDKLAQKIIDSGGNQVAFRVISLVRGHGFKPTASQIQAKKIMKKNFFGVEEAIRCFGVDPTDERLKILSKIPFSKETLQKCKDTHILVAVFPISIEEIMRRVGYDLFERTVITANFAEEEGETGWHLIRKTPVDNSTLRTWHEQEVLIGKDEEVPTARVMIYTIMGHYLVTDERLFEDFYVRTISIWDGCHGGGHHVYVGRFDSDGLDIHSHWDFERTKVTCIASAKKR